MGQESENDGRVKDVPPVDLVKRELSASRPNQLAVADLTFVATRPGFVYLPLVIDRLVHHSDRGNQLGFKGSSSRIPLLPRFSARR